MKALRIKLHQTSANYRKEETIDNKMTYPLPPISTVTGALHSICGYTEYHKMLVSIQGNYQSMQNKIYTHHCFLNSTMDDRGLLVKMKNENLLSTAYDKVAEAKKSQGNSFLKGITIQVYNQGLLDEYRNLKEMGNKIALWKKSEEYTDKVAMYKTKKQQLTKQKKTLDKKSTEYTDLVEKEKELKQEKKDWKNKIKEYEETHYKKPIAKFRSLTKSVKKYEILNNITLILHIQAEESVLQDIMENIYDLKSLGRSEDFVDVEEIKLVDLVEPEEEIISSYSAYVNYRDTKSINNVGDGNIIVLTSEGIQGTKYYMGTEYKKEKGKRIFLQDKKVPVVYVSNHSVDEESKNVWIDNAGDEQYIVNFLQK